MVVLIGGSVPEPCARGGDRPAGHSRLSNQINQKNQTDKMDQIDQMDQLPATRREIFPGTFSSFGASLWMAQVMPRPVRKKLMSPVDTFGEEA